jgi:hypothetical protein
MQKQFSLSHEDLMDMALSHIAPSGLFMNRPEELLVGEITILIRDQAEFVGPVAEDEGNKGKDLIDLYLVSL